MTQNQIRFWELRWKQHYENEYLKIQRKEAETRRYSAETERLKAQETVRHNRAEERHEQQRIIQENVKIAQNWAKLKEEQRANIMHEFIETLKVGVDKQKADTEAYRVRKTLEIEFGKLSLAEQETALAAVNAINENNRAWFKELVNAVKIAYPDIELNASVDLQLPKELGGSGFRLGAGSKMNPAVGELLEFYMTQPLVNKWLPGNSNAYEKILNKDLSTIVENYGPAAPSKAQEIAGKESSSIKGNKYQLPAKLDDKVVSSMSDTQHVTDHTQKYSNNDASPGVQYVSSGDKVGSTRDAVYVAPSSGSSGVIYSPGSHHGPGYNL